MFESADGLGVLGKPCRPTVRPFLEIARRAGHSSVVTVLDRYGHLLPKDEDRVTDVLDAMARAGAEQVAREVVGGAVAILRPST